MIFSPSSHQWAEEKRRKKSGKRQSQRKIMLLCTVRNRCSPVPSWGWPCVPTAPGEESVRKAVSIHSSHSRDFENALKWKQAALHLQEGPLLASSSSLCALTAPLFAPHPPAPGTELQQLCWLCGSSWRITQLPARRERAPSAQWTTRNPHLCCSRTLQETFAQQVTVHPPVPSYHAALEPRLPSARARHHTQRGDASWGWNDPLCWSMGQPSTVTMSRKQHGQNSLFWAFLWFSFSTPKSSNLAIKVNNPLPPSPSARLKITRSLEGCSSSWSFSIWAFLPRVM